MQTFLFKVIYTFLFFLTGCFEFSFFVLLRLFYIRIVARSFTLVNQNQLLRAEFFSGSTLTHPVATTEL